MNDAITIYREEVERAGLSVPLDAMTSGAAAYWMRCFWMAASLIGVPAEPREPRMNWLAVLTGHEVESARNLTGTEIQILLRLSDLALLKQDLKELYDEEVRSVS